jgi:hypothetical protein
MVRKGRVVKMIDEEVIWLEEITYRWMKRVNSYWLKRDHIDHHLLRVKRHGSQHHMLKEDKTNNSCQQFGSITTEKFHFLWDQEH